MLIGIIIIAFGSIQSTTCNKLISSELGELESGNFIYYKYPQNINFRLELDSLVGDCDLYVSDRYQYVNYTNYDLQSTTCGKDEISIDHDLKRPIYASVFAHPYYSSCKYVLNQFADPEEADSISSENEDLNESDESGEKESTLWWLLINLLEVIAEIFL